jgi:uncharacterized membrane protein
MSRLLGYFLRGLVFTAPVAITVYVCWIVFRWIDQLLGFRIPGVGFAITIALVTLVGFLGSNFITRSAIGLLDRILNRLPFVRLLYGSTKDLLNAFVGEKRRFDKPVMVRISADARARMLGFVTQDSLARLGLDGFVAVYFPQSYNFAGNVLAFPADQVERIDAASSDVMAFIVSGGVTTVPAAAGADAGPAAGASPESSARR